MGAHWAPSGPHAFAPSGPHSWAPKRAPCLPPQGRDSVFCSSKVLQRNDLDADVLNKDEVRPSAELLRSVNSGYCLATFNSELWLMFSFALRSDYTTAFSMISCGTGLNSIILIGHTRYVLGFCGPQGRKSLKALQPWTKLVF